MPSADSVRVSSSTDISSEPVTGFSKFKQCLKAEKILQILYKNDYLIFISVRFILSLNCSIILIFISKNPPQKLRFRNFVY